MIVMPLGPQFMRAFQVRADDFGLLVSSYTFSAGITNLAAAFILDRFSRKGALLTCYFGHTLATILSGLAPTHDTFMMSRILAGGFGGLIAALVFSYIGDVFPTSRRGAATGIVMSAFSMSSVIGVPFGLFLANWRGWQFPFLFLSFLGFLIFIVSYFHLPSILPTPKSARESAWKNFTYIVKDFNHWKSFSFMFVMMMAGFTIIPFVSPSLVSNAGVLESELPLIYMFGGGLTLFTSPWFGRLSDRYGGIKVFTVIATLSIIPILLVTQLVPGSLYFTLIVTTLFMSLVSGRMVPAMTVVQNAVTPSRRGAFMSVNSAIQQLSAGVATYLASKMILQEGNRLVHYDRVGYVAAIATVLSIGIIWRIQYRDQGQVKKEVAHGS